MNKVFWLLLLLCVLLAGCVPNRAVVMSEKMQKFLGKNDSELFLAWGAPHTSVVSSDGKTIYTWFEYSAGTINCSPTFVTSQNGIVEAWSHDCVTPWDKDIKTSGSLVNP